MWELGSALLGPVFALVNAVRGRREGQRRDQQFVVLARGIESGAFTWKNGKPINGLRVLRPDPVMVKLTVPEPRVTFTPAAS